MKFKRFFWDYLYFTKVERLGITALVLALLLLLLAPSLFRYFQPSETPPLPLALPVTQPLTAAETAMAPFAFNPNTATLEDFRRLGLSEKTAQSILKYRSKGGFFKKPEDLARIYTLSEADFQRLLPWIRLKDAPAQPASQETEAQADGPAPKTDVALSPFDPNTVALEQLLQMGLPRQTATGWTHYLKKGGKFRFKEDIQKLYALSADDYQRILPFVLLPSRSEPLVAPVAYAGGHSYSKSAARAIDLNASDAEQWMSLPGIGQGWAQRILRFRDKLGGFTHVQQVAETKGLPDSVFQKIAPYLELRQPVTPVIHLNSADFETLNGHPYIEAREARWLVAYRQQHGPYQQISDVLKIPEIKPAWFEKLKPYLAL